MLAGGNSELSVFVLDSNGRKITDVQEQKVLVQCMEEEVGHPVRIKVGTRGIDTELLVATPIEKCGRGRPRVLYDVTLALKMLNICIFKVFHSFQAIFFTPSFCSSEYLIHFSLEYINILVSNHGSVK